MLTRYVGRGGDKKEGAASAAPSYVRSRQRPTLPPRLQGSTIGAGGLNFWVRNGTRCDPSAVTTGKPGGHPSASPGFRDLSNCQCLLPFRGTLNAPERARAIPSPRPISTGRLNTLLCLQLRPINLVV